MAINFSPASRVLTVIAVACAVCSSAFAQLSKPTAEDLGARGPTAQTQTTPAVTIPPSADPRDISGTWSAMDPVRGPGGGMAAGAGGMAAGGAAPGAAGMNAAPPAAGGPQSAGIAGPGVAAGMGAETGSTRLQCYPSFTSFGGVEGVVDIIQTDRVTIMVGQEMQLVRRIYMNAQHPGNVQPSFFGDSVGHWEGDTLVVDTVGIRSGNATRHVVERIRKVNDGQNLEAVMTDATGGAAARTSSVYWNPARKLAEWICEDADEFWKQDYR